MPNIAPWLRARRYRRPAIALLALAGAVLVPAAGLTFAQAAPNVHDDCTYKWRGADSLVDLCEYLETNHRDSVTGDALKVSATTENCQGTTTARKSLTWRAEVNVVALTEKGSIKTQDAALEIPGIAKVGQNLVSMNIKISGTRVDTGTAATISGDLQPGTQGWVNFRPYFVESSGYMKAKYKEEQNGALEHFWPFEGGTGMQVRFPKTLDDGRPDGRLSLYWEACGTSPQGADSDLRSGEIELPYP